MQGYLKKIGGVALVLAFIFNVGLTASAEAKSYSQKKVIPQSEENYEQEQPLRQENPPVSHPNSIRLGAPDYYPPPVPYYYNNVGYPPPPPQGERRTFYPEPRYHHPGGSHVPPVYVP